MTKLLYMLVPVQGNGLRLGGLMREGGTGRKHAELKGDYAKNRMELIGAPVLRSMAAYRRSHHVPAPDYVPTPA